MINRGKLIPRSSKSNTVKSNSVSDLYVIKGAAIKVDNILKERLVLSKVREGILRQEEERRIRSGREMLLEKDVKNNYNVEDTDKVQKKKSGLGGLLGTVFKGILGSLGSVAFGLTPSLLGVGLVLKKLTNPFLLITGVAFTALNVIVSKSGSQFKELNRKVNKDDISAGKIEKGARDVRDSLLTAVSLYASGSVVGAGARGLIGGKLVTRRQAQEIGVKETIEEIKRGDVKSADRVIKNRGRIIQKTLTSDSGYGSGSALAEVPNPAKIRGQFTMEGIKYPIYDSALSPAENMMRFLNAEAGYVNKTVELETPSVKKQKVTQLDLSTELNKKIIRQRSLFEEGFINKTINQARELERRQAIATLKDMDLGDVQSALADFPDDPRLAEAMADPDMAMIEEMELGKRKLSKRFT